MKNSSNLLQYIWTDDSVEFMAVVIKDKIIRDIKDKNKAKGLKSKKEVEEIRKIVDQWSTETDSYFYRLCSFSELEKGLLFQDHSFPLFTSSFENIREIYAEFRQQLPEKQKLHIFSVFIPKRTRLLCSKAVSFLNPDEVRLDFDTAFHVENIKEIKIENKLYPLIEGVTAFVAQEDTYQEFKHEKYIPIPALRSFERSN